ncbi:hypothetical protein F9B85_06250 [Heliorestis acidaminivorans]|uniref:Uncharacterized protein n=1 Tax=Heliorestis acidaminivorans TaxID=553427 RepID=A0A6I0ER90_9FIRM|nr:hypothetical protein [Heliorestis acidaminivorans]KAB2952879.1 hypothetical protein F9B85_06250 [Heliorestis acidaminivorans]
MKTAWVTQMALYGDIASPFGLGIKTEEPSNSKLQIEIAPSLEITIQSAHGIKWKDVQGYEIIQVSRQGKTTSTHLNNQEFDLLTTTKQEETELANDQIAPELHEQSNQERTLEEIAHF